MRQQSKPLFLNHCPFCGIDNLEVGQQDDGQFAVECLRCEFSGPRVADVNEAIRRWNDRILPPGAEHDPKRIWVRDDVLNNAILWFGRAMGYVHYRQSEKPRIRELIESDLEQMEIAFTKIREERQTEIG